MRRIRQEPCPQDRSENRSGLAVVELALCLPLILMMTFGAIEAANSIYLKQTLKTAAYEAARAATGPGGTQNDGQSKFEEVLASRNVKNAEITFNPSIASISQQGTPVTITVTAPSNSNSVGPQWYTKGAVVRAQVIMPKL